MLSTTANGSWGSGDWADFGPFSNIFGGTNGWAVGPFDPIRPESTLLSDGKVDAGDAPMPALRVDVALGAASTAGTLSAVDKTDIYIRDSSKDPGDNHNLYAPFYKAYIPAAWNGSSTSGVFGATFANNYASFLTQGFDLPTQRCCSGQRRQQPVQPCTAVRLLGRVPAGHAGRLQRLLTTSAAIRSRCRPATSARPSTRTSTARPTSSSTRMQATS